MSRMSRLPHPVDDRDTQGTWAQVQALRRVALAVAHPGGGGLFRDLVFELAAGLGVAVVFVALFADESRAALRTRAICLDGKPLPDFDYPLAGSPCENVVGRHCVYVASGIAPTLPPGSIFFDSGIDSYAGFPLNDSAGEPLGLLVAMDRRPIAGGDAEHTESMLRIIAGRMCAELERERTDEALRAAALAVSASRGQTVFDELVRLLARLVGVEMAFIARHDAEREPGFLRILSMVQDEQLQRDIPYAILGTPCETVLGQQFRIYPSCVQTHFPLDQDARAQGMESYAGHPLFSLNGQALGVVVVASRRPMLQCERIEAMLKIFAVRAAAEVDRQCANEQLARSEASYRAIFEASEDSIFIHDWDTGEILDVNGKACETYGYSHDELLRVQLADISSGVAPYTGDEAARYIQLAKLGRCPPIEWHRRNRDGSLHWDEVRLKPAMIGGRPHMLAFTREITDRKRALEQLERSEARLRATVEAAFDGVIGMDSQGLVIEFNAAAERIFGHRRQEVIGRPLAEVVLPPRLREAHARGLRRYLEGDRSRRLGQLVETAGLRADGSEFPVELAISAATVAEGSIFVFHVRDISARRAAEAQRLALEAQLRQAQKMEAIGQLTGGIAHDFNNMLTSVIGYLAMAQERPAAADDPVLARQLGQSRLAAERARDHVAQLLAFSRPRRGERRLLDPCAVARQAVELLRPTLPAGVEVDASGLQGTGASVLADGGQLEQAVFNLCINARDALGRSGHLRVRSGQGPARERHCASCSAPLSAGPWCWVEVADDGPGFPAEVVGRMFEPFFTTKEVGLGTGLGLAMVHGIVHDHGGHVEVSAAPGRGACFRVLLPLAASPGQAAGAEQPASGAARERRPLKGRVLVVEDETLVGDFLHEQLADWGLEAVLERDPRLALDRLRRRERFDLLLTDLTMPHLSGLELASEARRLHPELPVLLCTGDGTGLTEGDLSRCGVSTLLAKPVDPARLRRLLEQFVGVPVT